MIRDDLAKAARALDVASLVLESGAADDAVNRAYYSAFHVARALVELVEPNSGGKTHKPVLNAFSNHYVRNGKLPKEYGAKINKAMSARHVADYQGDSITEEEAATHIAFAQELLDRALEFIPSSEHPERRLISLADAMREEAAKMALASAFCELAERRGEVLPRGFAEDLALYGDTEKLTELIAAVDTMNDVQSYVLATIPVPSAG
jgi:hypothetical protein